MGTLVKLLRHGWRTVREVHTVIWLISDVLGVSLAPVVLSVWALARGLPAPVIAAIAFVTLGISVLVLLAFLGYRAQRRGAAGKTSGTKAAPQSTAISADIAEHIPDLRVADNPSVIELFDGNEKDKLFPLLEANKLTAWARPMRGEAPGKEAAPVILKGDIWKTHYFDFHARVPGQFDRNQIFIKTKTRNDTRYYDVFVNRYQIKLIWPDLEHDFVSLREAARLAYEAAEGTMHGKLNDRLDKTPTERIEHHIEGILNRKVVLYGRSPPSSRLRPIPKSEMAALRWIEGTDALKSRYAAQPGHYEDVVVGRISLQSYLDHLKRIGGATF